MSRYRLARISWDIAALRVAFPREVCLDMSFQVASNAERLVTLITTERSLQLSQEESMVVSTNDFFDTPFRG